MTSRLKKHEIEKLRTAIFKQQNSAKNCPGDIVDSIERAGFEIVKAPADVRRLMDDNDKMREALEWYGENARLCRLVHSEGDAGRHALSADGGTRARSALSKQ